MKKLITTTALMIALFFTANAQRWERGNERQDGNRNENRNWNSGQEGRNNYQVNQVHNDNRYENRGGYRNEDNRNGYGHEERRDFDKGGYYQPERNVYYHAEPRVVYHRDYYQPQRITYHYYPSANVYYNPFNHIYTYPWRGEWVNAEELPNGFYTNELHREVYCNEGENICAYNAAHIHAFGGEVVVGRRSSPVQFRLGVRF